jgi:hypothetical protein
MDRRVQAEDVADMVLGHIARAGEEGVTLAELVGLTGLEYRVLHNVTWVLEGSPEPSPGSPNYGVPRHPDRIRARRLKSSGRTVRYTALTAPADEPEPDAGALVADAVPPQRVPGELDGQVVPDSPKPGSGRFLVNAAGDIYGRQLDDSSQEEIDPDSWGWASLTHRTAPEDRYTIDELAALPGIAVTISATPSFEPGPRRRGTRWMAWPPGSAPPAHYEAKRGAGGYYSRLSELLGYVATSLPANPFSSPYVVHDFVQGRRLEIAYTTPTVGPGGHGIVYVIDDGYALKFGHTTKAPAIRVNNLQTGNPRPLRAIATIAPASAEVEAHLHRRLAAWHVRGEWYAREPLLAAADNAGGWQHYLRSLLPTGTWDIATHQPDPRS